MNQTPVSTLTPTGANADPASGPAGPPSATGGPARDPRRRIDVKRVIVRVSRVVLPLALLLGWETTTGDPKTEPGVLFDSFFISKPSEIWAALEGWGEEGVLLESIQATVVAMLYGFTIGAVLGILVGIALGSNNALFFASNAFVPDYLNSIGRGDMIGTTLGWLNGSQLFGSFSMLVMPERL